jgi:DNA-binding Lrp family transcriptional regulator
VTDPGKPISEPVDRFLARYVGSIEQLEILLLLAEQPSRSFRAGEVAQIIYASPESVVRRLRKMENDQLISATDETDPAYTYAPRSSELDQVIQELARAYRERRVAVITLIASRPMENVRAFSDAFRLGKKDKP